MYNKVWPCSHIYLHGGIFTHVTDCVQMKPIKRMLTEKPHRIYRTKGVAVKKIILTGGGTAGHVTPNCALVPTLKQRGYALEYIGTRSGIEFELIRREKLRFHTIAAGKLRRYLDLKNLTDLFLIGLGFLQSFFILLTSRPVAIFSKGGFVSVPVVWSAWFLRIPVVIHESDISPGLANRLALPFANNICYSFLETKKYLPAAKSVHTGLPIRETLLTGDAAKGKRICEFTSDKPTILIIGGSLGSVVINNAVREALPELLTHYTVCHICGRGNVTDEQPGYRQFSYVTDELPHLFALAVIVVGRSGATTLFELLALKKPNLLIPLSSGASRGDQILNAESFERQGFSRVLLQENLTKDTLVAAIDTVYAERAGMVAAMEKSSTPHGVDAVVKVIESV